MKFSIHSNIKYRNIAFTCNILQHSVRYKSKVFYIKLLAFLRISVVYIFLYMLCNNTFDFV
uniref:Uncharacterized protein n=1 Tax=Podoviridae sp. ctG4L18 TaxID=2825234 RepID=A0A8S5UNY9_9CAUD|nr:MAG TPA: hypothetical protein [Podoviridae sp. ctG4L18]